MIFKSRVGQGSTEYTHFRCDECGKLLVLDPEATEKDLESKGWEWNKEKGLHICPKCNSFVSELIEETKKRADDINDDSVKAQVRKLQSKNRKLDD